ncbi:RED-like protein N-terminal region-domain-containing protein [Phakopsora pachyrhizi]|uniref:RED-like protein N-terminal region-domain-containing protein n=1 Tax=Phakopsora pachyrhizi TaxID=170000 RepID=A0AAV0B809_PHAPC|nr:RED-like protein N-terminal region-domain-containing protein [Phakopsora pachyrhizi]CAH7682560.1 RED-like protein N-terminal region-domain-containing protein [Phakopsora pachyrhizi]
MKKHYFFVLVLILSTFYFFTWIRSEPTNKSQSSNSTTKPPKKSYRPPKESDQKSSKNNSNKDKESNVGYRDRASERRKGLDGDFAEAEQLLQNFQARVAAAGSQVDKELLEQQTKYLGGDERHTILVKGLDHALLERRKAELSSLGKLSTVTDEDLEEAFKQNELRKKSTQEEQEEDYQRQGYDQSSKEKKKRSRDEILNSLKASRAQQPASDLIVVDRLKCMGKFKPIGSASNEQLKKEDEEGQQQSRLKKSEKKEKKEKKRRKKEEKLKKERERERQPISEENVGDDKETGPEVCPPDQKPYSKSDVQTAKPTSVPQNLTLDDFKQLSLPSKDREEALKSQKTEKATEIQMIDTKDNEDDADIFEEAGDYKGLDDSSTDEESQRGSTSKLKDRELRKNKSYFEDDQLLIGSKNNDLEEKGGELEKGKRREGSHNKQGIDLSKGMVGKTMREENVRSEDEEGDPEEGQKDRMIRLEGLSGSTDVKVLLAVDEVQENEERRRLKKNKKRNKEEKVLSQKDKLNRDFMEMERFIKRKKGNESGDKD